MRLSGTFSQSLPSVQHQKTDSFETLGSQYMFGKAHRNYRSGTASNLTQSESVGCTFVTSSDSCNGVRCAGTGTAAHIRSQTEGFGNFARRRAKEPWERVKPGTKVTWERVVCCFCCCMTVRIPEELGAFRLLRRRYMNSFHVYLLLGWASCLGGWVFAWWRDSWVLTRSMMSDDAGDDDESVSQFLH